MVSSNSTPLNPNSTLADLETYKYQVDASTLGEVVSNEFQQSPELPGVIIKDGEDVVGVISRRKFLEQMSQPYSLELYMRRPIRVLLEVMESEVLRLNHDYQIDQAVRKALNRSRDLVYEPIVVIQPDNSFELLEVHDLLLAQSKIFVQINKIVNKQKEEARQYAENLKKEQAKVQEYTRQLEQKQIEAQRRNETLERQRAKLSRQASAISELNERFVQLGELLSQEGKETFSQMLSSVEAISDCTARIMKVGKGFREELESVDSATQLIERVSQQVRNLSIQAALVANRPQSGAQGQISGLGRITSEIGNLGNRTSEATNEVNQIAYRFRNQIEELTNAAQESEDVARSLVKRSQQTQQALDELERLINQYKEDNTIDTSLEEEEETSQKPTGNPQSV
ncbi:MAG: chemotaxis protein [Halothece sp.]